MLNLFSNIVKPLNLLKQIATRPCFSTLHTFSNITNSELLVPQSLSITSIRTKVRNYFPRPNEVRRIRRHGWEHRMSTPNGRKIIMRRILKGKHVITH